MSNKLSLALKEMRESNGWLNFRSYDAPEAKKRGRTRDQRMIELRRCLEPPLKSREIASGEGGREAG
jgi:hypothetical protein